MRLLLILLALSLSSFTPDGLSDIRTVLKHVETNNRPDAVGDNGKAYGVLQIHQAAILDVNNHYGTNYRHQDAFEVNCAEEIFNLYIGLGIKRFKHFNGCRSPTEQDIVRMWNGGIYSGYKRSTTIKYYRKYKTYKKLLCE